MHSFEVACGAEKVTIDLDGAGQRGMVADEHRRLHPRFKSTAWNPNHCAESEVYEAMEVQPKLSPRVGSRNELRSMVLSPAFTTFGFELWM